MEPMLYFRNGGGRVVGRLKILDLMKNPKLESFNNTQE
jgi:hypothetical protein